MSDQANILRGALGLMAPKAPEAGQAQRYRGGQFLRACRGLVSSKGFLETTGMTGFSEYLVAGGEPERPDAKVATIYR